MGWVRHWAVLSALIMLGGLRHNALAIGELPDLGFPTAAAEPEVAVSVVAPNASIEPGQTFDLEVRLKVRRGLQLYSFSPQGAYAELKAMRLTVTAGDWEVGEPLYPKPQWHAVTIGEVTENNLVYTDQISVYVPIVASPTASSPQKIVARVEGQTCDDGGVCIQFDRTAETLVAPGALSAANAAYAPSPVELRTAAQWESALVVEPAGRGATGTDLPGAAMGTLAALALALAAGIALNVMPCVLPVLPIKIMSILQQARESRRRSITLGAAYATGIFLFFAAAGAISVSVRLTTGAVFNLNEPFGNPWFLVGISLILVAAAMWLFGIFTITISGGSGGAKLPTNHAGSVGMGFFTALLATPCSGPILVAVFGWAQGQPAWAGGAVFGLLGLGMAAPHAILAAFPNLLAKLPVPGVWMERLKQGMGIVLLLVAVWLISTLNDVAWSAWVTAYAVILSGCLWLAGTCVTFTTPAVRRRVVRIGALIIALVAGGLMLPAPPAETIAWRAFEPGAIEAAATGDSVVLVKYTAAWCTVCKLVDYTIYNRPEVAAELVARGVVAIKADVTRTDSPAGRRLKNELGEPGPPVTVIYGPALAEPIRLHGQFTRDELYDALDRAAAAP